MRSYRWRILAGWFLAMCLVNVLPWPQGHQTQGVLYASTFPFGRVPDPLSGTPLEPASEPPKQHVVSPGETLTSIASRYGVDPRRLASANNIRHPDRLMVGQSLTIPQLQPTFYIVERGDTLGRIALRFGITVRDLADANSIENPNLIRVGQRLTIPGQEYVAEALPAQTSRYVNVGLSPASGVGPGLSPLSWPVLGTVTSGFGPRWGRLHTGLDIAARYGTEVTACSDGVVEFAGRKGSYGNLIVVRHSDGISSYYGHLSRIEVERGMLILAGEAIGRVGTSGNTTGPHLHFEVRKGGTPVNPRRMLP